MRSGAAALALCLMAVVAAGDDGGDVAASVVATVGSGVGAGSENWKMGTEGASSVGAPDG